MGKLFETTTIGGLQLANRFVRSATWTGLADDDGNCPPALAGLISELARGGVGLIVTGHAYVHPSGKHAPRQLGIDSDRRIEGLSGLTRAVHDAGGKIAIQLGYGGAYLSRARVGQMTGDDFRNLAAAYAAAALRAERAGFDGVQIFAAHGFFLSQMLCPRYNPRTDAYGGALENRTRCLLEVTDAVRQAVGGDFPVLVKLNAHDGIPDGLSLSESVQIGEMLQRHGLDAIELSGGLLNNPNVLTATSGDVAYLEAESRTFKERITIPLVLVGGIRSLTAAERIVNDGIADFVSLCRPLICEPGLVNRWKAGDTRDAACISCNNCVEQIKQGGGVACVPVQPERPQNFFPQKVQTVPAGPLHPPGTAYVVSFGLLEGPSGFVPGVKVHMTLSGDEREHCPVFFPGSDGHERVSRVVARLLAGGESPEG